MFSLIFPGQGSQLVGMGKDLHAKYSLVQDLFKEADDTLGFSLSNLILNGPKEELEKNEIIDKNLLRYMTVRVKKFNLEAKYFSKKDEYEKKEYKRD